MPNQNTQSDEILFMDESGEFQSLGKDDFETGKPITSIIDTGKEELMLQPPPPVIWKETASFYFHPEDEEEVAKIKPPADLSLQKKYSLDKILDRTVAAFKLTLDDDLKKRLRAIIFSFLKDTRTGLDVLSTMKKEKALGGLAWDSVTAEKTLKFLTDVKVKIAGERGQVIDEAMQAAAEKSKPLLSAMYSPKPLRTGLTSEKPLIPPKPPAAVKPAPVAPIKRPAPVNIARKKSKSLMDDIQKDFKLVGPIEELASLTLRIFRRLGSDAAAQAAKISQKIDLLGEQSLIKKVQGIQAWRRSPLYKMYLAIGQASMEHGLTVQKVIEQYLSQSQEIMTLEEFEAITDLNKQFRF